jgi:sterol desaturase/sphingolipid hydroxylase (fatty acid hydroxylase superfamily)
MTAAAVFASGLIFVVVSAMIFWPLEELLEGDKVARPKFKDIAYLWFYQSYGLWLGAGIVYELAFLVRGLMPHSWSHFVQQQPFWLQAAVALLMAEVWVYFVHRLAHRSNFLWKFHSVHHTLTEMTWSASSRQHPVDFLLIIVGANLPAMILGIDLRSITLFVILERLYTVLLHSNLNLDWGWVSKIVASPKLHSMHHMPAGQGKNYAGILSFLDVLGKTYEPPGRVNGQLGNIEHGQRDDDPVGAEFAHLRTIAGAVDSSVIS